MQKAKVSSSTASSGRSEGTGNLSSYIQMKSPIIGTLEFEATVPEIPVDPALLSYDHELTGLSYEPSALEIADRLTAFHEFDHGLECQALDGICYAGSGIEDHNLISQLEEEFAKLKGPIFQERLAEWRRQMMDTPEMELLQPLLAKACEDLPDNVHNTLFPPEDTITSAAFEGDPFPTERSRGSNPAMDENLRECWSNMSKDERVEHYLAQIKANFVEPTYLQHPTRPNAKIAKHYKVLPNISLWKRRYVQAGIEGLITGSNGDVSVNLDVGGILHVAYDGATQRMFNYYTKAEDNHEEPRQTEDDDVANPEKKEGERFSFVRKYSYQKSTNTVASDNYFILSLPPTLHKDVKSKVTVVSNPLKSGDGMDLDEGTTKDLSQPVIEIVSLKGQKLVLTRAGKAKRPDLILHPTDKTTSS